MTLHDTQRATSIMTTQTPCPQQPRLWLRSPGAPDDSGLAFGGICGAPGAIAPGVSWSGGGAMGVIRDGVNVPGANVPRGYDSGGSVPRASLPARTPTKQRLVPEGADHGFGPSTTMAAARSFEATPHTSGLAGLGSIAERGKASLHTQPSRLYCCALHVAAR
jgi:hypothetical protein